MINIEDSIGKTKNLPLDLRIQSLIQILNREISIIYNDGFISIVEKLFDNQIKFTKLETSDGFDYTIDFN